MVIMQPGRYAIELCKHREYIGSWKSESKEKVWSVVDLCLSVDHRTKYNYYYDSTNHIVCTFQTRSEAIAYAFRLNRRD